MTFRLASSCKQPRASRGNPFPHRSLPFSKVAMTISVVLGLGYLTGSTTPAAHAQDYRAIAAWDRESRAIDRAERRLCGRWRPIAIRLGGGRTRSGGLDYVAATDRVQPHWTELPAPPFRRILNEWVLRSAPGTTRAKATEIVAGHLKNRSIRIWQSSVRFRRFSGPLTVTRIGFVPYDENSKGAVPKDADFRTSGYWYVISLGKPTEEDVMTYMEISSGYLFLDAGYGYMMDPGYSLILALYPKEIHPTAGPTVPGRWDHVCD
ncbi:MAG: hypothetical protein JWR80_1984 [Bradyrhizobium sp.]|nr:hypothetical protein [Bradyrhizobium sp.]